jgi:ArsR family transcriptional regulator
MEDLLNTLRATGEPTRLRLLALCARGELTVSELTRILGQSQPRVSRHLKLLCDAGLLERFREGTSAFYRLAERSEASRLGRFLVEAIPAEDETVALDLQRLDAVKKDRAEAAASYFREKAPEWDEVRSLYVDEREVERALLDLVPQSGLGGLLDIGTGTGRVLALLAPRFERAFGIDLSREMLAYARANLEAANTGNTTVRQGDMYKLPWPHGSFDVVTVHQVLHFADRPNLAIAEAARVLRPEGLLIVVDFTPHEVEALRSEHAHHRLGFADAEIDAWCGAVGLKPGKPLHLLGDPLTVGIWSARRPASSERARPRQRAVAAAAED